MSNTTEKHIHLVSFDVPWPANYGGVIDVFYKIKAMAAKGVKIHLHCFEYGRTHAQELENYCYKVHYYKRDISKRNLFRSTPYIVSSRYSDSLIENLLRDNHPILLEGLHTCSILEDPRLEHRRISVRTHNVEHEYYLNLAKAETGIFRKYYYYNEAGKLKRFEKVLDRADQLVAISKKDEKYFSAHYPRVEFVPAFHPHKDILIKPGKGDYALYHGNLSVAENINAVRFLVNNVFTDLKVKFKVAGLNPPAQIVNLIAPLPNVEIVANPSDQELFELINNAHINISITFQATGLKLKLLNTLYNGRFCLVNEQMLSGSALDDLCIIANDAKSLRKQIRELFKKSFDEASIEQRRLKLGSLYNNGNNVSKLIELIS
jgi:hypothetical protein